jgi:WD40 repeat protein
MCPAARFAALLLILLSLLGSALEQKPVGDAGPRLDADGEPLPSGALFRFGTSLFRADDGIHATALSPDGNTVAIRGHGAITLINLATGRRIKTLEDAGTRTIIPSSGLLSISPLGKIAFAGATYVAISGPGPHEAGALYDLDTSQVIARLQAEKSFIYSGWFTRDGRQLVTAHQAVSTQERKLILSFWDAASGQALRAVEIHDAAYPPGDVGGDRFICWREKGAILLDLPTGKELLRWDIPSGVGQMSLSHDGTLLAHSAQGLVQVWRLNETRKTAEAVFKQALAEGEIASPLRFSRDNRLLFAGTASGPIRRWDWNAKHEFDALTGLSSQAHAFHFSNDGKTLIGPCQDQTIRRFDLTTGKELPLPDGYVNGLQFAVSPSGRWLVIGDSRGRVDLWDFPTRRRVRCLYETGPAIAKLAWSEDRLLAVGRRDATVALYEVAAAREIGVLRLDDGPGKPTRDIMASLQFGSDGSRLLVCTWNTGCQFWDVKERVRLWSFARTEGVRAVLSPDDKMLVAAETTRPLQVRDIRTGQILFERDVARGPQGREPAITAMIWCSQQGALAMAHTDGTIRLWDRVTPNESRRLLGHEGGVLCLDVAADGRWLVSAGIDRSIRLWELATGQEAFAIRDVSAWPRAVALTPDRQAVLFDAGTSVLLWSLQP